MTANMTSSTSKMVSPTLSSRMLVTPHLENSSGLSISRHRLLPTPTHDLLDTATASRLIFTTILHLKSVLVQGCRQPFKQNSIANLIVSSFAALTFYCFVALLAFHTKTITVCSAYALGLAIYVVTFFETNGTIYAMMQRSEFTLERIRTVAAHLVCTTGHPGLANFSFEMNPGSGLGYGDSPVVGCMQKEDNAARQQQHRKERSTSETKVQLYNDLFPEDQHVLKADKCTKLQQEKTIPYVLNATLQHESSKARPATYKDSTPDLHTGQESNMKTVENHWSLTIPEAQPSESMFQMTLRNSMHRSKRPRSTRSHMSISVKECSSEDSYFKEGFRMNLWSEDEASRESSGLSTPDSESMTPESDFQAGLRMMLGSACGRRRTARRGSKSGPSTIDSESSSRESEFQTRFREAIWPGVSRKRRIRTPGSETWSEESDFQAEFRAIMWNGGERKVF